MNLINLAILSVILDLLNGYSFPLFNSSFPGKGLLRSSRNFTDSIAMNGITLLPSFQNSILLINEGEAKKPEGKNLSFNIYDNPNYIQHLLASTFIKFSNSIFGNDNLFKDDNIYKFDDHLLPLKSNNKIKRRVGKMSNLVSQLSLYEDRKNNNYDRLTPSFPEVQENIAENVKTPSFVLDDNLEQSYHLTGNNQYDGMKVRYDKFRDENGNKGKYLTCNIENEDGFIYNNRFKRKGTSKMASHLLESKKKSVNLNPNEDGLIFHKKLARGKSSSRIASHLLKRRKNNLNLNNNEDEPQENLENLSFNNRSTDHLTEDISLNSDTNVGKFKCWKEGRKVVKCLHGDVEYNIVLPKENMSKNEIECIINKIYNRVELDNDTYALPSVLKGSYLRKKRINDIFNLNPSTSNDFIYVLNKKSGNMKCSKINKFGRSNNEKKLCSPNNLKCKQKKVGFTHDLKRRMIMSCRLKTTTTQCSINKGKTARYYLPKIHKCRTVDLCPCKYVEVFPARTTCIMPKVPIITESTRCPEYTTDEGSTECLCTEKSTTMCTVAVRDNRTVETVPENIHKTDIIDDLRRPYTTMSYPCSDENGGQHRRKGVMKKQKFKLNSDKRLSLNTSRRPRISIQRQIKKRCQNGCSCNCGCECPEVSGENNSKNKFELRPNQLVRKSELNSGETYIIENIDNHWNMDLCSERCRMSGLVNSQLKCSCNCGCSCSKKDKNKIENFTNYDLYLNIKVH